MASITRTVKTDYKNKEIAIHGNEFINSDGEIVNVVEELRSAFGEDSFFDLSVSVSVKEDITPTENE